MIYTQKPNATACAPLETWIKPIHAGKSIASTLKLRTEYAKDFDKTDGGELIAAFECDERTVDADFLLSKKLYEQLTGRTQSKANIIAYHVRQSFKPGEVTAEQALKIGYDLARRWTKNKHQFIVAAHTNTNSPHTGSSSALHISVSLSVSL